MKSAGSSSILLVKATSLKAGYQALNWHASTSSTVIERTLPAPYSKVQCMHYAIQLLFVFVREISELKIR